MTAASSGGGKRIFDPATQSTGLAAHSLRAARPEEAGELYAEARRLGLPFHIHLEEQEAEIEEVRSAYGDGPLKLLVERLDGAEGLTAIHCTHSTTADLESLARAGGRVCLCPTTEGDLGDGLPELAAILDRGPLPALGTDSNLRVSLSEEMRWLEWGQRLLSRRRGVVTDAGGDSARRLFELATSGGARSLGLEVGAIRAGVPADLVQLDLDHPSLAGCGPDELLASFVFGGADEAIVATSVGGHWREHRRRRG